MAGAWGWTSWEGGGRLRLTLGRQYNQASIAIIISRLVGQDSGQGREQGTACVITIAWPNPCYAGRVGRARRREPGLVSRFPAARTSAHTFKYRMVGFCSEDWTSGRN